jgi:hypothetical protein
MAYLVADYYVVMKFNNDSSGIGSFRLQKYVDGFCSPRILVTHDSSIQKEQHNIICQFSQDKRYTMIRDNMLVSLDITSGNVVNEINEINEIKVFNMLTRKQYYVLPRRYRDVSQQYQDRLGQRWVKENMVYMEDIIKNTITESKFLEKFNNAGKKHVQTVHETDKTLCALYNELAETKRRLNKVGEINSQLSSEINDLGKTMATMLKDISYHNNVAPMIEL